jgi:predicted nucleic acid-binding protein
MYLIDTDVLSLLRRADQRPVLTRWMLRKPKASLFLSAITIGELERGIIRQSPQNPRFAKDLETWLDATLTTFGDRILYVDTRVARRWGQLCGRLGHESADLFIAATALEHDLTVATRNVRHFGPTGARVENPLADPA